MSKSIKKSKKPNAEVVIKPFYREITPASSVQGSDENDQVLDSFTPEMTYLPDSHKGYWYGFKQDCLRHFSEKVDPSITPRLIRYHEADWSSMYRFIPVDIPRILKAKKRAVPDAGHSISRIVTIARHATENADYDFYLAPEIVSLVWSTDGVLPDASHPVWEVDDGTTASIIDAFCKAPELLRGEAVSEAKAAASKSWRRSKYDRRRVIYQVRLQTPIKKCVFGSGQGAELVQKALVTPMQRVNFLRRNPDTLSREDIIDRLWGEAYGDSPDRPQRVKI